MSQISATSRYFNTEVRKLETEDGRTIVYLARRFVPAPERFAEMAQHVVVEGDRPDRLAGAYLGDPEMFWRLCDANRLVDPEDLVSPVGRVLRITLPEGVPGPKDE